MDAVTARTLSFLQGDHIKELFKGINYRIENAALKGRRSIEIHGQDLYSRVHFKIEGDFSSLSGLAILQEIEREYRGKGFNTEVNWEKAGTIDRKIQSVVIKW